MRDTEATSNGNGSSLGEGAISPVALENGGAPGIPRVVTSIPRSRDRSYFCLYFSKYYSRRLRRFRASSAKVWAVTEDGEMDDVEMDSVETGNEDGSSTSSKETAPNSPSSRCDGNKEVVQDADSKPEDEGKETTSRLGRLLLLYSGEEYLYLYLTVRPLSQTCSGEDRADIRSLRNRLSRTHKAACSCPWRCLHRGALVLIDRSGVWANRHRLL